MLQPTIAPATGSYYGTQNVTFSNLTTGASYYYTTNNSTPTTASTLYTGSFPVSATTTVKAIGFKSGSSNSPMGQSDLEFSPWDVTTGPNVWNTFAVPAQAGPFTAAFRVRVNSAVSDSVVGFGINPVAGNGDLAANLLFNVNGKVQVRTNTGYTPEPGTYSYLANTDYDVSMVINPATGIVTSASITQVSPAGPTTVLATNAPFRFTPATPLDNFGFRAGTSTGVVTVSNLTLTPAAAEPNTYYVSKDTGNDTTGTGTLALPWATYTKGLNTISGGDTLVIRESATPYNEAGFNITTDSGPSASQPTTIKAYPGETPELIGPTSANYIFAFTGVSNFLVEGLDMSGPNHCIRIRQNLATDPDTVSSNITVRNCILHDTTNQLVFVHGNSHTLLFENNIMSDPAEAFPVDHNGEAFYIGSHNGIDTYPEPDVQDFSHDIIIRGNQIDNCKHEAVDLKHDTYNVTVEDNIISNCVKNFQYGKWSILANPEINRNANSNHIIRRNYISGQGRPTSESAAIGLAGGVECYNNVIMDVADGAYAISIIGGDSYTRYLWHNTMEIDPAWAVHFGGGTSNIGNNIGPNIPATKNIQYLASYFVNAAGGDFRLVAGSAPVNAGLTQTPFPILKDFDNVDRTSPPDIGAYEAVVTVPDVTAPTPSPMTWEVNPMATAPDKVFMRATEATDATNPPTEYFFEELTGHPGGTDSGWQESRDYEDVGLTPETLYTYTVRARDKATVPNVGATSDSRNVTTLVAPDPGRVSAENVSTGTLETLGQ